MGYLHKLQQNLLILSFSPPLLSLDFRCTLLKVYISSLTCATELCSLFLSGTLPLSFALLLPHTHNGWLCLTRHGEAQRRLRGGARPRARLPRVRGRGGAAAADGDARLQRHLPHVAHHAGGARARRARLLQRPQLGAAGAAALRPDAGCAGAGLPHHREDREAAGEGAGREGAHLRLLPLLGLQDHLVQGDVGVRGALRPRPRRARHRAATARVHLRGDALGVARQHLRYLDPEHDRLHCVREPRRGCARLCAGGDGQRCHRLQRQGAALTHEAAARQPAPAHAHLPRRRPGRARLWRVHRRSLEGCRRQGQGGGRHADRHSDEQRRPRAHHVHERHDWQPQGRHAHARQRGGWHPRAQPAPGGPLQGRRARRDLLRLPSHGAHPRVCDHQHLCQPRHPCRLRQPAHTDGRLCDPPRRPAGVQAQGDYRRAARV
ncbi:fatty acyl CoA syntetase 1 [Strigomonas culicis]|uniref:Fatty acyl CoA syntetase 1 n=1 Tax=Strigomonas culicis TaxID=28005 RepID=S9V8S8_9TRYP|nr:fatty acyl CoA syntetase 1 [Strigomonas culicis]|eukprot:EPY37193.1 fatty acyl CoA syntetase 1 [Strigomonas culicis]